MLALGDKGQDEIAGHLHAAIQIQSGNDGLKGIGHHAGAGAAAAALLAAAQAQVLAQVDLLRELEQRPLADEAGPDAGQIALGAVGVGMEQIIRRDDLQHAVAQKLQPLVVLDRHPALVGIAGVGKGRFQQLRILELIADNGFQLMAHASLPPFNSSSAVCMVPHRSFSTQIFA